MKTFEELTEALNRTKADVDARESAKTVEVQAVAKLKEVTAQATQTVQDATQAREEAHNGTAAARTKVKEDRALVMSILDAVIAEPGEGE